MSITLARWSLDEYHAILNAGVFSDRPIELLNGLIVEMAPEGPDHAEASNNVLEFFIGVARGRYRVRPAKPISIPQIASEPEPDLALVNPRSYGQQHPLPEDVFLVIEFSKSSLAKDTEEKRKIYAEAGIQDYWVVNLKDLQVIVYRNPMDGDYQLEQRMKSGAIAPLAFPDIALDVTTLLP